jgi:hypothetical protein
MGTGKEENRWNSGQVIDERKGLKSKSLYTKSDLLQVGVTDLKKKWAGKDSNLRRLTPTGLQPVPFSRSGTDP